MALHNYSTDRLIVTVNAKQISDWGESDPPFEYETVLEGTMRKGLGGGACRLDPVEEGQQFTLHLNPGSPASKWMSGLKASRATITVSHSQLGTFEAGIGREGMISTRGPVGRGGQSITDDSYTIICNKYSGTTGGA